MATPEQIEATIRAIRPPWNTVRQAFDWYGMCAGLTYRTILENGGTTTNPYGSAWLAYLDTRIESAVASKAPPGAIHYWDYTGVASNGQRARWGHVAIDILGGGTDVLSATGHAHEVWNKSAGLISVPAQTARGMKYLGWSHTYGRSNRLNISTPANGGGSTPFDPQEDDMTPEQATQLDAIYKALFGPNNGPFKTKSPLSWANVSGDGESAKYGLLSIAIHNQKLIAGVAAQIDYTKLAGEIVKAGGTAPTAAQIAKAVNDDAAKRLTS